MTTTPPVDLWAAPTREGSVLPYVLADWAARTPSAPFAVYSDGSTWSYEETAARTWGLAWTLAGRTGVRRGDHVASWLPNGPEAVLSWLAASSLGAVYAPFNTAYRGPQIEHALTLTRAIVLVAHVDLLDRLVGLDLPHLRWVIVVGDGEVSELGVRVCSFAELAAARAEAPPGLDPPLEPWDDCAVLMTSGTTGQSKAVRRTYAQYDRYTRTTFRLPGADAADRFYVCAPLFHGGADTPLPAMLQLGASVMVDDGFTASGFWGRVRRFGCTIAWLHSAMSLFLDKQPPREDDADNPLRLAMLAPLFPGFEDFVRRFDVRVYMVYGMTEMTCPFCVVDPVEVGDLGSAADPGYELRLVDEHDNEVPAGVPGELVVRHELPWVVTPGYLHDAAATARVWRNGWFHSGDRFVRDESGSFRLVDRVKDSIRRRGEFVSAAEVEQMLLDMPDVAEAAVIGIPAELEEEVLAYYSLAPAATTSPQEIHARLVGGLAYFAVPRFLVRRQSLPRNVALRPDKPALRAAGIPSDAWDAQASGMQPTREGLG